MMKQRDEKKITLTKYEEVLRFLYSFFVCYNVIGEEKSNKLEDTIYKYAPILEKNYSEDVLNEFIDSISTMPTEAVLFPVHCKKRW